MNQLAKHLPVISFIVCLFLLINLGIELDERCDGIVSDWFDNIVIEIIEFIDHF